jgi:hypothetical protein
VLLLLLLLLLPRGGCCRGERVHVWADLSIARICRWKRGVSLVQSGLRSRVLWHGVMPTFTLVMGNGRVLGECGERAGRVAWRNEGRI